MVDEHAMNVNASEQNQAGLWSTSSTKSCTELATRASDADRAEAYASEKRRAGNLWRQRADRLTLALITVFALAVLNCAHFFREGGGQLQFMSQNLNYQALAVIVLIPAVVLLIRLVVPYTPSKMCLAAVSFVIAIFSLLYGSFFLTRRTLMLTTQTVSSGDTVIRCFRVEGFDTLAIAVHQERIVLPGVVWSVPLHRENFARDVRVSAIDDHYARYAFYKQTLHGSETSLPSRVVVLPIR